MSVILKFGGSSVADAACIRRVADIARAAASRSPVVVLSAMGKTTDAALCRGPGRGTGRDRGGPSGSARQRREAQGSLLRTLGRSAPRRY